MGVLDKKKCLKLPLSPTTRVENGSQLPLLISVPHGGYTVPLDIQPMVSLDYQDIFPDSDPYTRSIYSLQKEVMYHYDADIARAIVDLNRREDDLPPLNPDGVIKSQTILGKKIYKNGPLPEANTRKQLLDRYYHPYHQKLKENLDDPNLLCGLDCHSMLEYPPGEEKVHQNPRPFICLSNNGDEYGEGTGDDTLTCPPHLINLLADCLRQEFPEEADNIVLNTPFKGGHISLAHSQELPWIQVELNRRAYLKKPWFAPSTLTVERNRLQELRRKFLQSFSTFCFEAGSMQYPLNYAHLQSQNKGNEYPLEYSLSTTLSGRR